MIIAVCITIVSILGSSSYAHQTVDEVVVAGQILKPGPYSYLPKTESLAELLNRVGGLPVTPEDLKKYQAGEPVDHVRVVLYRDGKKMEFRIDPKSRQLWDFKVRNHDVFEVVRLGPFERNDFSSTLKLTKPKPGEQAVAPNGP